MCLKTRIEKLERITPSTPVDDVVRVKYFDGSTGQGFRYRDKPGVEVNPEDIMWANKVKEPLLVIRNIRRFCE